MEPKAYGTAASMETTGIDYRRYATYRPLKNLSHCYPELWINLVHVAHDDLHNNYIFSGKEYALERRDETQLEENGRRGMVRAVFRRSRRCVME
jgi:hypothetical protein